jgi:hypothetical protein
VPQILARYPGSVTNSGIDLLAPSAKSGDENPQPEIPWMRNPAFIMLKQTGNLAADNGLIL